MSVTAPTLAPSKSPLVSGRLPRFAQPVVLIGALVLGAAVWLPFGKPSPVGWAIASMVFYAVAIGIVSGIVEGKRHAVDRVATGVVTSAFILVLLP
jgi:phosphate transport system permease protein